MTLMTPDEFKAAFAEAEPGDEILYFTGNLARSRHGMSDDARSAEAIGRCVWCAYETAKGFPVQRRLDGGGTEAAAGGPFAGQGCDYLFVKA